MIEPALLTIEGPEYGERSFHDIDHVLEWIAQERPFWEFGTFNAYDVGFIDFNRRDYVRSRLDHAAAEAQQFRNDHSGSHLATIGQMLNEYLSFGLWSKSPRAQFITSLRDNPDNGMLMAQAALSTCLGDASLSNSAQQAVAYRYPSMLGRMEMLCFDAGLKPDALGKVSDGIKAIIAENVKAVSELVTVYTAKIDELAVMNNKTREENAKLVEALQSSANGEIEKMLSAKDEAVSACQAAKAFYTTDMELRAPINYWSEEHDKHTQSSAIWGKRLVKYSCCGFAVLVATIGLAFYYATTNTNDKLSHTDFLVTGGVAVVITILFWIARFISRLYLSERHMAIDAGSRVTMAKTFLSLAANKNVDEKDRALVLAPLFRPGTDGIIKEDTGVDSIIGMVARVLERPAKS